MPPLFGEEQALELFECIVSRVSTLNQLNQFSLTRLKPELFATLKRQDNFSAARSKRIKELYLLLRTDTNVVQHPAKEAKRIAQLLWKHTQKIGEGWDRVIQIFLKDFKASEEIAIKSYAYPKVTFYRGLYGYYERLSNGRI